MKLKNVYLYKNDNSIIVSNLKQNIIIDSKFSNEITNIVDYFKIDRNKNDFFEYINNDINSINIFKELYKRNFFYDYPIKIQEFIIITHESLINKISDVLKDENFNYTFVTEDTFELLKIKDLSEKIFILYLPYKPKLFIEILNNYNYLNIKKIIAMHTHLNEIWSIYIEVPKTPCPKCFSQRLLNNLPFFKYLVDSDVEKIEKNGINFSLEILKNNIESISNIDISIRTPPIAGQLNIVNFVTNTINKEILIRNLNCSCCNTENDINNSIGEHIGIIKKIKTIPIKDNLPRLVFMSGVVGGEDITSGGAIDIDFSVCKNRSIGECIERYSWINYKKDILYSTWNNLPVDNRVPIYNFNIYSDKQYSNDNFPYNKLNADKEIHWILVKSLDESKKKYIPAELVLGTKKIYSNNITSRTSSGVASGIDIDMAKKNAVLELIERDVVSKSLLTGKNIFKIDRECLQKNKLYYRCLEKNLLYDIFLLKNKYNIFVSICVLFRKNDEKNICYYGFSSGDELYSTIDKSIKEAILMSNSIDSMIMKNKIDLNEVLIENKFLENAQIINLSNIISKVNFNYSDLSNIFYVDITTDDIRSLGRIVISTWGIGMIDFVERREIAPLNIISEEYKVLYPYRLPFY